MRIQYAESVTHIVCFVCEYFQK